MPLTSGTKIGPYEIISLIGAGGMGEVYRATDSRLRREVAVKILPQSFSQDADRLRRFEQEARVVSALNHPNILAIFDVGAQGGAPYLVSELLEGESLRQHMQGALAQRKAVDYGMQISRGLAAAHEKGVVHRDLKPDNIFVLNDGRIKILDFGLAKLRQDDALASDAQNGQTLDHPPSGTTPGQVLGTVGYMSPEQVRGQAADHRADIFALGAILYEMLSGQRAFKRDSSVETMNAILKEEPPELQEVAANLTPGLDRVVRHCLEKNPVQRFQSASDIAFDLEMISSQSGTGARLKSVAAERRSYWKQAIAIVTVAAALVATYYVARRSAPTLTPRFHQLTFQRGTILGARFAPDGQSILFSAAWNGAPREQIYTTRTDALMPRPIDLMHSTVLSVSPKGEMAIRQRSAAVASQGMLSVVPLTGGAPRDLLDDVVDASWGPRGDTLAAVHIVNGEDHLEYPLGKTILSIKTGDISNLAVSPDGKFIAYFDHPNVGDTRGYVAVTDLSGNARRLTQEWGDLTGLAWSRSGDEIWFTGCDTGINSALYAVDLKGKSRDLLHIPGRLHLFDISKDGAVLLTNEASRMEAYGHSMGEPKDTDLSWFDWSITRAVSRDGQWVVLEEDGEGGSSQYSIFLRKTDGSPAILLGGGMGLDISPDAKWVASTSVKQPAPTVLLPTGAGQPITLADGALYHTQNLQFLPDGKGMIMVASEPGKSPRTYIEMIDGTPPRTFGPPDFLVAAVSPDQKTVLGLKGRDFWMIPMSGGKPGEILPFLKSHEFIAGWSADGNSIYVAQPSAPPDKVYTLNLKSGERKLHHENAPADPSGVLAVRVGKVTPDGKFYAYDVARNLSYLYVVEGLK